MYKEFAVCFSSLFMLISSTSAISGIGQCGLDLSLSDLKVIGCVEYSGSNILKLLPVSQPALVNALDSIPIFIVSSSSIDSLMDVVGEGDSYYNNLIKLPYPEGIVDYSDASEGVRLITTMEGWEVLKPKYVAYGRSDGQGGPWLICSTLTKRVRESYIAISQCNSINKAEIARLKKLLRLVERQPR